MATYPAIIKRAAESVLRDDIAALSEAVAVARGVMATEAATLRDLQAQVRNQSWTQLAGGATKASFTRNELGTIVDLCRAAALKNPLIIRGLAFRQQYVFGQGVSIEVDDEQQKAALTAFLADKRNRKQLTGHQGYLYAQLELDTTGNLYTACIAEDMSGRALPVPQVRTVPFEDVQGVISNPDDREDVWFFKRVRRSAKFDPASPDGISGEKDVTEWHPSLDYWRQTRGSREQRLARIGGYVVRWDAPIAHRRRGGFNHWRYGLPIVYAALDWATAHTRYLSNWDSFVSALAQVALTMTKKGATQDQLTAMKAAIDSGFVGSGTREDNPAPIAGSTMVLSDKVKFEAFRASGMAPEIGDAKGFRLQIAAALGVPDHFLAGDVDQGNLATARTLDRPTELAIGSEQEAWIEYLEDIALWALEATRRSNVQAQTVVRVSFPAILEHDPQKLTEATAKAVSTPIAGDLAGAEREIRKALLEAAGVSDVASILDKASFEPGAGLSPPAPAPGGPNPFPLSPDGPPDPNAQAAGEAIATRYARRIIKEARRLQAEAA